MLHAPYKTERNTDTSDSCLASSFHGQDFERTLAFKFGVYNVYIYIYVYIGKIDKTFQVFFYTLGTIYLRKFTKRSNRHEKS